MKKEYQILITFTDRAIPPKAIYYIGHKGNAERIAGSLQKYWRAVIEDPFCYVNKEVEETNE